MIGHVRVKGPVALLKGNSTSCLSPGVGENYFICEYVYVRF